MSGIECTGLVQAIHTALTSPRRSASNSATAGRPGRADSRSAGNCHSRSSSARSLALAISRCAASIVAMPPTSRPPIAFGCPVSENGPAPGLPICAVARCRWISARFLSVPCADWFRPMQYSDSAGASRPNHSAACTRSATGTPQMSAAIAGVYSRSVCRSSAKPCVCAAMNPRSMRSSQIRWCSMPLNSATSVPGWIGRCRSAIAAVSVRRGSTTIQRTCGSRARASSSRRNSTGWA